MFNRPEGFSILLHPFTDRFVEDHTSRAAWLGKQLECPLTEFGKLQEQFDADIAGGKNKTVEMWKAIEPVDDIGSGASMKGHAIETLQGIPVLGSSHSQQDAVMETCQSTTP